MANSYNLGKVSLTPRGEYVSSATYERLDVVGYAGNSFCVLQTVTGVTPSTEETSYYAILCRKGATGNAATVTVGSVTEVPAGGQITVTNVGTSNDAIFNFQLAKGNLWYYGTGVTGTASTPAVFVNSGVTNAGVGDLYLNTSAGSDQGNVYRCTLGGDANTAKWMYVVCIKGSAEDAVSYTQQSPTTAQQEMARTNINAMSADSHVLLYDIQSLQSSDKNQARQNIDAVGTSRTVNGKALTSDVTISDADIPSANPSLTTRQYQQAQDSAISLLETNLGRESEGMYIPGDERTTVFNSDGSITTTYESGGKVITVFNADGSITDTEYNSSNVAIRYKTTTFNADGSISEVIEDIIR